MASTQCICKECNISMPVDLNFRGSNVEFKNCKTTVKCPKCGASLIIMDGKYASNLYGKYLDELSQAYEESLRKIRTNHNFEHGDEFEIAICETLRLILPVKYGICRGYVVDAGGNFAGDDIIIYDPIRFPKIRLEEKERYDRLQQIPIEAVYVYIEAKNTLFIDGGGGQSLTKAVKQVSDVKKLIAKREPVMVGVPSPDHFPKMRNPMMGVLIANTVRYKKGGPILSDQDVMESFNDNEQIPNGNLGPEIILAGSNVIGLPFFKSSSDNFKIHLPYYSPESVFVTNIAPGVAFGTMVAAILLGMEWVVLGPMPWRSIIADGLGIRIN